MAQRKVDVTPEDDRLLQGAQEAAMAFVDATRVWSQELLQEVRSPLTLVVEIGETPVRAARLADLLGQLTAGRTVKAASSETLEDALDQLIRALQVLRPVLSRLGASQAEEVAVALGWLESLRDLLARAEDAKDQARGEATKAIPGGGAHGHAMVEGELVEDGDHVHLLQLADGKMALTGRSGAHRHTLDLLLAGVATGSHGHQLRLPDGAEVELAPAGEHIHEMEEDLDGTTHGGVHVHRLSLDGQEVYTLLPDTLLEKQHTAAMWSSPGGKATLAKTLAQVIPQGKVYVEPFCGSGAVFFKREPSETEVLADADEDAVAALRKAQALNAADLRQLEAMSWRADRREFERLKAASPRRGTLKWFRRYLYLKVFSVGGLGKSYRGDLPGATRDSRIIARVRKLQPRLEGVHLEVADYRDTIRRWDSPETVFFFDPPYKGYSPMGLKEAAFDEEDFLRTLGTIKGQWVVTYGAKGGLDFKGHHVHRVQAQANPSLGGKGGGTRGSKLETIVASSVALDWTGVADSYTTKVAKLAERAGGEVRLVKADHPEEERYILGVVLEPNDGTDGPLAPDSQGDVYSAAEIRQAAHLFMERYRNLGHQHRELVTGSKLRILESYLTLADMVVGLDGEAVGHPDLRGAIESGRLKVAAGAQPIYRGTWLLGLRVVDGAMWEDVKQGRITGLSIGGSGRRTEAKLP